MEKVIKEKETKIENILIHNNNIPNLTEKEAKYYIDKEKENIDTNKNKIKKITLTLKENNNIEIDTLLSPVKFTRIRRITGYLVGDLSRWNNGKKAEEKDRIKHEIA